VILPSTPLGAAFISISAGSGWRGITRSPSSISPVDMWMRASDDSGDVCSTFAQPSRSTW
jgi:hypothetical protein